MEVLDIYDENRVFTGKTMVRDKGRIELKEGEYVLHVKCWIINKDNKVLLTQRRKDKYNGGMWEPTGGLAISGETSIQAIKRELYEEIGLEIKENTLELIDSHRDDRFFRDISSGKVQRLMTTSNTEKNSVTSSGIIIIY